MKKIFFVLGIACTYFYVLTFMQEFIIDNQSSFFVIAKTEAARTCTYNQDCPFRDEVCVGGECKFTPGDAGGSYNCNEICKYPGYECSGGILGQQICQRSKLYCDTTKYCKERGLGSYCYNHSCETEDPTNTPVLTDTPIAPTQKPSEGVCKDMVTRLVCCSNGPGNAKYVSYNSSRRDAVCSAEGECIQTDTTCPSTAMPANTPTPTVTPMPIRGQQPPRGGQQPTEEPAQEPTRPPEPSYTCPVPTNLRSEAPVPDLDQRFTRITLRWDVPGGAMSYIRVSDGNDGSKSASGPVVNNCLSGNDDVCIDYWQGSNQMTVQVEKGKSYRWWVHASGNGCGMSAEQSQNFSTAAGQGSPSGGSGGSSGGGSGIGSSCSASTTCTYTEPSNGLCYAGKGIRGHNQAGCAYFCGPVSCPSGGGGSTGGSGGLAGGGRPPIGPSPTPEACNTSGVSLSTVQDGAYMTLSIRTPGSREGSAYVSESFSGGIDAASCTIPVENPGGSGIFTRQCRVLQSGPLNTNYTWTHAWKKNCDRNGRNCQTDCQKTSAPFTIEPTACQPDLVHLNVSLDRTNNKVVYKIASDDKSEGTNSIKDVFTPQPFESSQCTGFSSNPYLLTPGAGKVCTLRALAESTIYTWRHEWRRCRGSTGSACSAEVCSKTEIYQFDAGGSNLITPTIEPTGPTNTGSTPASTPVGSTPTVTLTPTPCPTRGPTYTPYPTGRGIGIGVLTITPTGQQPCR